MPADWSIVAHYMCLFLPLQHCPYIQRAALNSMSPDSLRRRRSLAGWAELVSFSRSKRSAAGGSGVGTYCTLNLHLSRHHYVRVLEKPVVARNPPGSLGSLLSILHERIAPSGLRSSPSRHFMISLVRVWETFRAKCCECNQS